MTHSEDDLASRTSSSDPPPAEAVDPLERACFSTWMRASSALEAKDYSGVISIVEKDSTVDLMRRSGLVGEKKHWCLRALDCEAVAQFELGNFEAAIESMEVYARLCADSDDCKCLAAVRADLTAWDLVVLAESRRVFEECDASHEALGQSKAPRFDLVHVNDELTGATGLKSAECYQIAERLLGMSRNLLRGSTAGTDDYMTVELAARIHEGLGRTQDASLTFDRAVRIAPNANKCEVRATGVRLRLQTLDVLWMKACRQYTPRSVRRQDIAQGSVEFKAMDKLIREMASQSVASFSRNPEFTSCNEALQLALAKLHAFAGDYDKADLTCSALEQRLNGREIVPVLGAPLSVRYCRDEIDRIVQMRRRVESAEK